ncbi:MAG: LptF/LptG family permease [Caulobacteraceae bacterium]|nr:LptF/LptG family permease [Caulobacteraceae bacterium]
MTLSRHIGRLVAFRIAAALVMIVALLQVMDLLDITTEILDRGLGFGGVVKYALLRLPRLVEQAAPLAALAGGLFAFAQLARDHAVTAMRAAGSSTYRVVGMALPAVVGLMIIQWAVAQFVAPRTDLELDAWWTATAPVADEDRADARPVRVGSDIATGAPGAIDGSTLGPVRIYRRDGQGRLVERIIAKGATHGPQGWALETPTFVRVAPDTLTDGAAADMTWPVNLTPKDVATLFSDAAAQPSAAEARRALEGGGAERSPAFYRMQLQRTFAAPFACLVMLLMTTPVALASFRAGQAGLYMAYGVAAGLLFLVIDGMLTAVGESGALSAPLAAWAAPVAFSALALTALLRLEG